MSERPGNWHLVGVGSDPLPGDPFEVGVEQSHYANTARGIREQVARLRAVAEGSHSNIGKFIEPIRDSAGDLAGHLDRAQGRFDTVASQLLVWKDELDTGRTRTAQLLSDAEQADAIIRAHPAPTTPADPTDTAAASAEDARGRLVARAQHDLDEAKKSFHTYMSQVDHVAERVGKAIKDASDDKLKDSWWDRHVRQTIHDHAQLLRWIADVFTWIATALIIAIVLLSNPAGWMLIVAMVLTAGALLAHSLLAANGDGSWVDVGLDVFALVTMGSGKLLSEGARAAFATKMGLQGFADSTKAARAAFTAEKGLFGKGAVWLTKSNFVVRNVRGVVAGLRDFQGALGELKGSVGWLTRISFGEKEGALLYQHILAATKELKPSILLNAAAVLSNGARAAFLSGAFVDLAGKIVNPAFQLGPEHYFKPGIPSWVHWVDEHTVSSSVNW